MLLKIAHIGHVHLHPLSVMESRQAVHGGGCVCVCVCMVVGVWGCGG